MATFFWERPAVPFVWDQWWGEELSGSFDADGATTSTHLELFDAANNVRIVVEGTGFNPTGPDTTPTAGTINSFEIKQGATTIMVLSDLSIGVIQFAGYLQAGNIDGFLNFILAGADTIVGNNAGDTLHGLGGADDVIGGGGRDRLYGDAGNDWISGGAGTDTVTGGAGRDDFVLNVFGGANQDIITDFRPRLDTIQLDAGVFEGLGRTGVLAAARFYEGAAAHDANDRIIYNPGTGALFYDANGDGAGDRIKIATLDSGLNLTNADFVSFFAPT